MVVTEQLVEEILKIHDCEFNKIEPFFHQAIYRINLGKWYWPYYFQATLDPLGFWRFDIGKYTLNDHRLIEKFDRIWGQEITKINAARDKEKELEFSKILATIKER